MKRKIIAIFSLLLIFSMIFTANVGMATSVKAEEAKKEEVKTENKVKKKEKFLTWQDVAKAMGKDFDKAIEDVKADKYDDAYKDMDHAYFGYYETQGFEKNVGTAISAKRVNIIETRFRDIKHTLKGYKDTDASHKDVVTKQIQELKYMVYRDAMVLDGVVGDDSSDEVGKAIDEGKVVEVNESVASLKTFTTAFVLLLREGLEAILVVVAIITYLIKTGNKHLCKGVYMGALVAIIASAVLAAILKIAIGQVDSSQELIEGLTMFLAVIVLFYVSNWMLHKSDEAVWEEYIQKQVKTSVDKQSQRTLIFAAFIAVFREGAELILFYQSSFAGGHARPMDIIWGILAGTAVLIAVWIIFRYTAVKIPLKPFFAFTSILLFIMCVTFVGKGVVELTEAGVISGGTTLPFMNGFTFDLLGIYDRAETLLPQIIVLIAAIWIYVSHKVETKRKIKAHKKENEVKAN